MKKYMSYFTVAVLILPLVHSAGYCYYQSDNCCKSIREGPIMAIYLTALALC